MYLKTGCSLPLDIPAPLASFAPRGKTYLLQPIFVPSL
jgi:hypothetical protein